jgi:ferric-dicitrate binding protein FerR (iron transport regulator)
VLAGAVVLALLAAGLMLYRQVTRLNYDLATATTELRAAWPTGPR